MTKIGRYQITRELGRGAMGIVYHAIDPTIGRAVAIKTLRLGDVDDGDQRRRLRDRLFREARSAGALSHPGIVTIYDMDEVDGLAYIAMEYVDGTTLEQLLSGPQPLPCDRVLDILRQTAAALDYAHRKGVIHRDIKPANIMIEAGGAAKITDFGIAKITQFEGHTLTGVLLGTPNYMSPEQVQGLEIDGRSDQFSLGVIAYEMLTGDRPFHGEQISTVVYKIVAEQPERAQTLNSSLTEKVDQVLRRALAKKPEKRFAACTSFVTGLATALAAVKNWKVPARKIRTEVSVATDAATMTARVPRKSSRKDPVQVETPRRKRSAIFPFLGAFLLLGGILALVAWQTGVLNVPWLPPPSQPSTPATAADQQPAAGAPNRPSPMRPEPNSLPETSSAPAAKVSEQTSTGTPVPVNISTTPPGATAKLDARSDATCTTPCQLTARPGTHNVTVTLDGYEGESREFHAADQGVDVPLIALRSSTGMLMLTSDPPSASITIDGKAMGEITPARVSLAPGTHHVTIERDGVQSSSDVQIRSGDMTLLKLTARRD